MEATAVRYEVDTAGESQDHEVVGRSESHSADSEHGSDVIALDAVGSVGLFDRETVGGNDEDDEEDTVGGEDEGDEPDTVGGEDEDDDNS